MMDTSAMHSIQLRGAYILRTTSARLGMSDRNRDAFVVELLDRGADTSPRVYYIAGEMLLWFDKGQIVEYVEVGNGASADPKFERIEL